MVFLNLLQVLRSLSELISPAAARASSVSCGTNDGDYVPEHTRISPFSAHY